MAIEYMQTVDIPMVCTVYQEGAMTQKPPTYFNKYMILKLIRSYDVAVYKKNGKIIGLVVFKVDGKIATLQFICSLTHGEGIGTSLLAFVNDVEGVNTILSTVSSLDERAINFYLARNFEYSHKLYHDALLVYAIKRTP